MQSYNYFFVVSAGAIAVESTVTGAFTESTASVVAVESVVSVLSVLELQAAKKITELTAKMEKNFFIWVESFMNF